MNFSTAKPMHNSNANPVLLVDDDPDDQNLIMHAFIQSGFDTPIQIIQDGEEALAYLLGEGKFHDRQKYPLPSFMLLDLNMPKIDGREVLSEVSVRNIKSFPIFVFTTSNTESDRKICMKTHADGFYQKPDSFRELVDIIKEITRPFNTKPNH